MKDKQFVKVPLELMNKITGTCDIIEFDVCTHRVKKLASEIRKQIDMGLDYIN